MSWVAVRRYGARALLALLVLVMVLIAAVVVNLVGIRMAGSIEDWHQWMRAHAGWFLVWRLLLYAVTVYGWLWMRRRLHAREPDGGARQRLLRVEIAAVLAVVALEVSRFM
ncbi:hypothetical protein [Coralloluteibacterium thermophilus]|uniref:Uncharacterized protein n=2 Tax=Gammaproteobacteria TaxID=1236 RepID=A0ABV9NQR4_9GAMM|nr:hypothetical protein FE254_07370 [Pseudomonas guguanensis]